MEPSATSGFAYSLLVIRSGFTTLSVTFIEPLALRPFRVVADDLDHLDWAGIWWFTPTTQIGILRSRLGQVGAGPDHVVCELPEGQSHDRIVSASPVSGQGPAPPLGLALFVAGFLSQAGILGQIATIA